jgi:hypothetical protein
LQVLLCPDFQGMLEKTEYSVNFPAEDWQNLGPQKRSSKTQKKEPMQYFKTKKIIHNLFIELEHTFDADKG